MEYAIIAAVIVSNIALYVKERRAKKEILYLRGCLDPLKQERINRLRRLYEESTQYVDRVRMGGVK